MQEINNNKPDYSFQLPQLLQYPLQLFLLLSLCITVLQLSCRDYPALMHICSVVLALFAVLYILINRVLTRITNLENRLEARERLLSEISLVGTERVLDVGCGSGIFLLGIAHKLTTGKGIGIDIWQENAGNCTKEQFWHNAHIEGVAEKVQLEEESICTLPYRDNYFHLITSSLTMHHLRSGKEYHKAINEMKRVLKPQGEVVIYDEPFTILLCTKLMQKEGFLVERRYRDMLFAKNK